VQGIFGRSFLWGQWKGYRIKIFLALLIAGFEEFSWHWLTGLQTRLRLRQVLSREYSKIHLCIFVIIKGHSCIESEFCCPPSQSFVRITFLNFNLNDKFYCFILELYNNTSAIFHLCLKMSRYNKTHLKT